MYLFVIVFTCHYMQFQSEVNETLPFFTTAWLACLAPLKFVPSFIYSDTDTALERARVGEEIYEWKLPWAWLRSAEQCREVS